MNEKKQNNLWVFFFFPLMTLLLLIISEVLKVFSLLIIQAKFIEQLNSIHWLENKKVLGSHKEESFTVNSCFLFLESSLSAVHHPLGAGFPNLWDLMPGDLRYHDVIIIETKCAINVMCLSHPETWSLKKLSSHEIGLSGPKCCPERQAACLLAETWGDSSCASSPSCKF